MALPREMTARACPGPQWSPRADLLAPQPVQFQTKRHQWGVDPDTQAAWAAWHCGSSASVTAAQRSPGSQDTSGASTLQGGREPLAEDVPPIKVSAVVPSPYWSVNCLTFMSWGLFTLWGLFLVSHGPYPAQEGDCPVSSTNGSVGIRCSFSCFSDRWDFFPTPPFSLPIQEGSRDWNTLFVGFHFRTMLFKPLVASENNTEGGCSPVLPLHMRAQIHVNGSYLTFGDVGFQYQY